MNLRTLGILHGAVDLFLDVRAGAQGALGGEDFAMSKPAGEHIKKMHAMFDENSATLLAIPEPMIRLETFVGSVILEKTMQKLSERFRFDQAADNIEKRIITLHQVGDEQKIFLLCQPN